MTRLLFRAYSPKEFEGAPPLFDFIHQNFPSPIQAPHLDAKTSMLFFMLDGIKAICPRGLWA